MGSSFAAFLAGMTPATRPTAVDKPNPSNTELVETMKGNLKAVAATKVIPTPIAMPIDPPTIETTTDSIRNWLRIALSVAPKALRTPISRVRSTTETNLKALISQFANVSAKNLSW